jgi:DNA polymerase
MSENVSELLSEVRRAIAREVAAGRGRVLDAELGARLMGPPPAASAPAASAPAASAPAAPAPAASAPAASAPAASAPPAAPDSAARAARLAELGERAAGCTRCVLSESRNRVVVGVGRIDPPLMLVGEAPGHDEDMSGEPFVGRAGQLLTRILAAMQLERSAVYIANVIKCRPPENRNPLPAEITACSPFLAEQIQLVRPRVLCALGRYAAATLLGTHQSLASLRGRVHEYQGIPVVVTYHPSALLRYPQYKKPTWEDMQVVLKLLAGPAAGESAAAGTAVPVVAAGVEA